MQAVCESEYYRESKHNNVNLRYGMPIDRDFLQLPRSHMLLVYIY